MATAGRRDGGTASYQTDGIATSCEAADGAGGGARTLTAPSMTFENFEIMLVTIGAGASR